MLKWRMRATLRTSLSRRGFASAGCCPSTVGVVCTRQLYGMTQVKNFARREGWLFSSFLNQSEEFGPGTPEFPSVHNGFARECRSRGLKEEAFDSEAETSQLEDA